MEDDDLEIQWTPEEQSDLDATTSWLESGTNAGALASDAGYLACATDAARKAYLLTYAPLTSLWDRISSRVRRALLEAKMTLMILDWVGNIIHGHGG